MAHLTCREDDSGEVQTEKTWFYSCDRVSGEPSARDACLTKRLDAVLFIARNDGNVISPTCGGGCYCVVALWSMAHPQKRRRTRAVL